MPNGKIRVLLVSNTLSCGGAERQITHMANALNESGRYEADVLYYAQKDGVFADALIRKPLFVDKDALGAWGCIRAIRRILKAGKYDVLHAAGGGSANIYGRAAAILARTPVIIGAMRGKRHFRTRSSRLVNNLLNLFANEWTVNNPALIPILKRDLIRIRDEKLKLLYNSYVDTNEVDYRRGEQTEYDVQKDGKFVFLTVGRCAKVKNFPLYLRAAAQVASRHDQACFWLIGDGGELDFLRELAIKLGLESKVVFFGFRDDVDVALDRADAYVQSSDSEGTPNTVLEAMRASLPIISTHCTDLTGILEDGVNGYLVACSDEAAMVEAMEKVLSLAKEERAKMGEASLQKFRHGFLAESAVSVWDEYYRSLLEEKK